MPYLVWVKGMRGPTPEKWPEMNRDKDNQIRPYLSIHQISHEALKYPLNELKKFFPIPHSS